MAKQLVVQEPLDTTTSSRGQRGLVDAVDHGPVGAVAGRGDQNPLRAGFEVGRRSVPLGEQSGAFQGDLDTQDAVIELSGIADRRHLDRPHADIDGVAVHHDCSREPTMNRIVTQEVGVGLDRTQIVDRDDFDIGPAMFGDRSQDEAADAAKAVDCDADGHVFRRSPAKFGRGFAVRAAEVKQAMAMRSFCRARRGGVIPVGEARESGGFGGFQ